MRVDRDGSGSHGTLGLKAVKAGGRVPLILNVNGPTLSCRVQRGLLGDGPALEHTVGLQAEVVMQLCSIVLLHNEDRPTMRFAGFNRRLRSLPEVTAA